MMDFNRFLSNTKTKKNLTQFLGTEVVKNINGNITAITHMGLFNKTAGGEVLQSDCCKHDEADTMLIFYASEAHRQGVANFRHKHSFRMFVFKISLV